MEINGKNYRAVYSSMGSPVGMYEMESGPSIPASSAEMPATTAPRVEKSTAPKAPYFGLEREMDEGELLKS